ncbi:MULTISPECIES: ABC transporter transmembrane domain-containing protein [Streptomyces]|uniref:ABC transporter transmembrane domain-containing protein n=1 Tax=Streptomyces TaxID=1883 RepID=UPI0027D2C3A7|nr:ABC transporter transmembrane domain-containing protein [Streptomyces changanensis]
MLAREAVERGAGGRAFGSVLLLLAAVFAAEASTGAVGRYLLERTGEGVVRRLRHGLVDRFLRLEVREYHRHRAGDLTSRVTADTTVLREVVSQALVDLVTGALVAAGAIALMAWLDPLLLLVALTVVVASMLVASMLKGIRAASAHTQDSVGAVAAELERALGALPLVRVHRAEEREAAAIGTPARCRRPRAGTAGPGPAGGATGPPRPGPRRRPCPRHGHGGHSRSRCHARHGVRRPPRPRLRPAGGRYRCGGTRTRPARRALRVHVGPARPARGVADGAVPAPGGPGRYLGCGQEHPVRPGGAVL